MNTLKIYSIVTLMAVGVIGCKTTNKVANIDNVKKKVEVQSTADNRSALPDPKNNRDINSSKAKLQEEVRRNPRDVDSLLNLAQIFLVQGDFEAAEKNCRQALKVDLKRTDTRKILAQIYLRKGNTDMAGIILNGIGGTSSKDSQILNAMALIAFKEDRFADSVALFNEALRVNPNDVAVRMNLGVLFLQYRQISNAAVQFERVLKVMPDHADAKLHLAVIEGTRGKYDKAEKIYKEILGTNESNPVALFNFAVLEDRREHYGDALVRLKSYLETPEAKKSSNSEVFALIDRIREKKDAAGNKVSDVEIQKMAAKMKMAPTTAAVEKTEEPKAESAPEKSTNGNADDVESLEKALK